MIIRDRRKPATSNFVLVAMAMLFISLSPFMPSAATATDDEPTNLQPQFEEGRVARYTIWTRRDSNVEMDFGGQSHAFDRATVAEGEVTWTIEKVNGDGSARCGMVIDWLVVTVTNPDGREIVADSRKSSSESPPLHEAVKALSNSAITFDVDAHAVITQVDGLQHVQRKLKDLPKDAFTETDLIETAYDLAIVGNAPAAAMPGDTWAHKLDRTHEVGTFHVAMDYRLAGTEWIEGQTIANIEGEGKFRFDPGNEAKEAKVDVSLRDAEAREQIMWDMHRHEVVGRNESRRYTLAMKIPIGDRGTARQTMTETVQNQSLRIDEKTD